MSKKLLVAIDIQNDFLKGGMLPYGYPEEDNLQRIVDYIRYNRFTDSEDTRLLLTKDTHTADFRNTMEGSRLPEHCIKGTFGHSTPYVEVDDAGHKARLEFIADEVILKKTFGTFDVVKWVRDFEERECEEIDEIQLIGYDLAICVLANAVILRAAFPNKKIAVLKDLCGCVSKETFDAAIKVLECQQVEVF